HRRRRDRHLGRLARHRLQELEIRRLNVLHVAQLAGYRHTRRRKIDLTIARVEFRRHTAGNSDALQALQEIDVKEGAAELAVGDALQTDGFLFTDDIADGVILDRAELV